MAESGEAADLEMLTRALAGITLQSLEVPGGEVSLPQFPLLFAASTLREVPSEFARREETAAAVVDRAGGGGDPLDQLLHARREDLREEEHRERPLLR